MKWEGYRLVPVKKIGLPGDIAARQKQLHVIELAESIKKLGQQPIHAPSIDGRTHKLIAGRDRMAAILLLKLKAVWCHIADEVTEQDALDLEVEENLHRRQDNRDDLIARRVKKVAASVKEERAAAPATDRGRGRPKSPEGEAREIVAREIGATPEAVRAAQTRASGELPDKKSDKSTKPPVTTYGIELSPENARAISGVQDLIDQADSFLRRAQGALTTLKGLNAIGAALWTRLQADVHRAADGVRRERPTSVCPCCKLIPARVGNCTFCGGLGVIGEDKLAAVAPELLLTGNKAMVADGRGEFVPYASALSGTAPSPRATKPAKKLTVEMVGPNGQVTPVDLDDQDEPF
jgi:ParB-like chromosome segregation protein Spo0J